MDIHVSCRKCPECISARKRHWIGRLMAEEKTSKAVWFVTLTYGGGYDNIDAYWINYSHAQKFFKKLRKDGHKFKYVIVGEHGTKLERAHFHCMLFWQSEPPAVEFATEYQWEPWEHGHSYIEIPRSKQGCAVYLMDYINKDNLKRAVMKYSKNPMLGSEYLIQYAENHVKEGISLFAKDAVFTIPTNLNKDGVPFYYPVGRDTSLYEKMIMAYLNLWAEVRPDQPIPLSEDLTDFLSDLCQNVDRLGPVLQRYIARHYGYEAVPDICFDTETTYAFENCNLIHRGECLHAVVYNQHGDEIWQSVVENLAFSASQKAVPQRELREALLSLRKCAPARVLPYLQELYARLNPECDQTISTLSGTGPTSLSLQGLHPELLPKKQWQRSDPSPNSAPIRKKSAFAAKSRSP